MQDSRQELESFFSDPLSAGLVFCTDGLATGYMAGIHICEENSADMLATNAFIKAEKETIFYISNIAILPEHRSPIFLEFLMHETATLLKSIDYRYMAGHVRKKTGLSRFLQRRYGGELLKTYDNWRNYNEPFDYILFDLENVPTLPMALDSTLTAIRKLRSRIKRIPWRD